MVGSARPLHPAFAAEISGIDLRTLTQPEEWADVRRLLDRYAVCVYRFAAPLTAGEQVTISEKLGPLDDAPTFIISGVRRRLTLPHIQDISNLEADEKLLALDSRLLAFRRADRLWHTDISFHPNRGVYSLLSARILPPTGGQTEFIDMRVVYEALPSEFRILLEDRIAEHSIWHSRRVAGFPEPTPEELASCHPVEHQLIQSHEGSGRKTLYMASHISHVMGLCREESDAVLARLRTFSTQQQFIYRHEWQVGDLVIWDNRITMHRGVEFDDTKYVRSLYRTTTRESAGV